MRWILLALTIMAGPALAYDWNIKPGDTRVTGPEMEALLIGRKIDWVDGTSSYFTFDGRFIYTEGGVDYPWERFRFFEDGMVCVYSGPDRRRCDLFVRNGADLLLINTWGGRYVAGLPGG